MKAFRFSLHAVRELRQSEEEAAQKAFAGAMRACEEAAGLLAMVDRDLQLAWQGLRESGRHGMRADQMQHARSWCVVLEEQQKKRAAELMVCQRQVDAAHRLMQTATQRREALDRLLRKQRRAHEREMQSANQKFLDEIATRGAWHGAVHMETT